MTGEIKFLRGLRQFVSIYIVARFCCSLPNEQFVIHLSVERITRVVLKQTAINIIAYKRQFLVYSNVVFKDR